MEKKGSDHFRDILNPYGEKSNYGKIGRRRRLSKLNVFFSHNSVGDHIEVPKFDPYPCHNSDNDHNPMIMIIVMVIPAFRPVFGPGLVTMMMDSLQVSQGSETDDSWAFCFLVAMCTNRLTRLVSWR